MLHATNTLVPAWNRPGAVELARQGCVKDVVDKRGFARTADTCDRNETTQWERDVNVVQVVFASTLNS